jgi:hypothetical protein
MIDKEKYIKGTEDNYTHIKFYYHGYSMTVNKSTYHHVYPNAKIGAEKFDYLIEKDSILKDEN